MKNNRGNSYVINYLVILVFVFFLFLCLTSIGATYKPYIEIGGAKYFKQKTSVAEIYDLFIPLTQQDNHLFFSDLRIFNRSGSSFETGVHLGYRKLSSDKEKMFGIYGSFDYKRSSNGNWFQQLMIGGEYWYDKLFVGGNVYQPIGSTKRLVNKNSEQVGRNISITKYYEQALPGVDGQLGYSFTENFTGYIGGYYFATPGSPNIAGPKFNLSYSYQKDNGRILEIIDGVNVEVGAQHDNPRGFSGYVSIKIKIGLSELESNSNISGFSRHLVELVKRDPDIVIGGAKEESVRVEQAESESSWSDSDDSQAVEKLLQDFGLHQDASLKEVRKKYREYILKYHPDRHIGDEELQKSMNQTMAYYNGLYELIKGSGQI